MRTPILIKLIILAASVVGTIFITYAMYEMMVNNIAIFISVTLVVSSGLLHSISAVVEEFEK